jgi:hypothetical protein
LAPSGEVIMRNRLRLSLKAAVGLACFGAFTAQIQAEQAEEPPQEPLLRIETEMHSARKP